jgi:hypothetical protein
MVSTMTEKCRAGVYAIRNIVTGQVYVGSSADFDVRRRQHSGRSGGSLKVQKSRREHGAGCVNFEVLERVNDGARLKEREQYWIDKLDACCPVHGFNEHNPIPSPFPTSRSCSQCGGTSERLKRLLTPVTPKLHKALKQLALDRDTTLEAIVRAALEAYVSAPPGKRAGT